ncbi:MAG: ATP-binding cassette domain-containing protein [Alphaproteobacteria bacterium]|jgi:ATP-binding cassette subfamily F protein uup|nr:ATP-binding cassette domain-containing protein [Alphaproteobacteria bacterium]
MPAPPVLALRNATIDFGDRPLFRGLDIALTPGEHACLVGRNGCGKSTLLKALAGAIDLDGGERFVQPGTRIGWLAQEADFRGAATLADFVAGGLPADMAEDRHRVDAALDGLRLDGGRDPQQLSGGEARRAGLARALVGEPEVLLLDEPTNHLDIPTIEWLESRLDAFRGALLLISHDRAFLNTLARAVLWLDRGTMRRREAGFAGFDDWVEQVFADEDKEAARLDQRIAAETHWLREGLTARRRRNMGRVRALDAMRAERRAREGRAGTAKLDPAEAARSGKLVIEAEGLSKSFAGPEDKPGGGTVIARGFSTRVLRGDRVGVVGPNGSGKTTLVRMLIGELPPDAGSLRLGTGLEIAYFDQRREVLGETARVREVLLPQGGDTIHVGGRPKHISGYLKDFLFDPKRIDSPVKSLSGGERNRLLLARLFARPSNLLVLDEPTNDLDMETLDLLEDVLGGYTGTVLLVSHDRDFLDRLVTSVIAVEGGGRVAEYVGGYTDYRRQRGDGPAASPGTPPAAGKTRPTAGKPAKESKEKPKGPARKLSDSQRRALDRLPGRIEALEAEIAALTGTLADSALYQRDPERFHAASDRLTAAQAELHEAEERWLELAELAESLGRA